MQDNGASNGTGAAEVPAGWYPDGSGGQRWWDGTRWTEFQQPLQQLQPQGTSDQDPAAQDPAVLSTPDQGTAQPALDVQYAQAVPRKRGLPRATLIAVILGGVLVLGAIIATVVLVSTALQSNNANPRSTTEAEATPAPNAERTPSTPSTPNSPAPSDAPAPNFTDMFTERDEFMAAQEQPMDGSPLSAKTPAQKEFAAAARAITEQNGGAWDATGESYALALALDACETSILNSHEITESSVRLHAGSSPLLSALVDQFPAEQQLAATTNLMGLTAVGTTYLCPADGDQWMSAVKTIGEDW